VLNVSVWVVERTSDGWVYTGKDSTFVEPNGKHILKIFTRRGSASSSLTSTARQTYETDRRNALKEKYGADYWREARNDPTPDWYDLSDEEKQTYKEERWVVTEYKLAPVEHS
jgi:hypothetical protein